MHGVRGEVSPGCNLQEMRSYDENARVEDVVSTGALSPPPPPPAEVLVYPGPWGPQQDDEPRTNSVDSSLQTSTGYPGTRPASLGRAGPEAGPGQDGGGGEGTS